MSWAAVLGLAGGAYLFKVTGLVLLGPRAAQGWALRAAALLPAALLPALVVVNTVAGDRALVVDARLGGLAAAVLTVWRKAPFWLTVTLAAATTAFLRAVSTP
ncbi:MAG: AzlD domain-containing protein [Acidimicrobiales bacterium]